MDAIPAISSTQEQILGERLTAYCRKYHIPIDSIMEILNDQKVLPMLRGKSLEHKASAELRRILEPQVWDVLKLNPNPNPGSPDEDIRLIYRRRTDLNLRVETKSAARGSFKDSARTQIAGAQFKVKCHRSRSNIKLKDTTNDAYSVSSFDLLVTNPYNALVKGNSEGEDFTYIFDENPALETLLLTHYQVTTKEELLNASAEDWRFVLPSEIAINGFLPRFPVVLLANDPHWRKLSELPATLAEVVRQRVGARRS